MMQQLQNKTRYQILSFLQKKYARQTDNGNRSTRPMTFTTTKFKLSRKKVYNSLSSPTDVRMPRDPVQGFPTCITQSVLRDLDGSTCITERARVMPHSGVMWQPHITVLVRSNQTRPQCLRGRNVKPLRNESKTMTK